MDIKEFEKKARAQLLEFRPYKRMEIDDYTQVEFWVKSSGKTKEVYQVTAKIYYSGKETWHCHCHNYTFKCTDTEEYKCKHILRCRNLLIEDGVLE